jgi:general secretion pathway protein D
MNTRLLAIALALLLVRLLGADPPAGGVPDAPPTGQAPPAATAEPGPGAVAPGAPPPATEVGPPAPAPAVAPEVPQPAPGPLPVATEPSTVRPSDNPELRFNFKGAALDAVLDYLSQAAGFVVVREVPVTGTADIVSHSPLSPDEAVALLHTVLNDRGYAVVRSDRVLRIVRRDDVRSRDIPVVAGADPEEVPRTSELVTQVISLRHTTANKLMETLKPLVPTGSTITTNEDSNALVITDTRANIRRLMEVVKALDSSVASILDIRVIPLQYADAVETADVVNKVYETPSSRSSNQSGRGGWRPGDFFARMRGGFGPPGMEGGAEAAPGSGGDASAEARQTAVYVKAVADQRGNAVVVTAPSELIPQIADLVAELDMPTEAVTTVRVFPLRVADATQMANVIAGLYPDTTTGNAAGRGRSGFFGGPPMPLGPQQPSQSASTQSQRKVTEAKVLAVADTRTNSVIVSASATTMADIETVIRDLDATPDNVPTVHVYQLQNGDPSRVKEVLNSMFEDLNTGGTSGNRQSTTRRNSFGTSTNRSTSGSPTQRNTGTTGFGGSSLR